MEIEESYEIIKLLGEGTFGKVYMAVDRETGETVALKELKQPCDEWQIQNEMNALDTLVHPKIVSLKGVVDTEKTTYLALEYMEETLDDHICQRLQMGAPFSEAEVREVSFQLFQGLDFMHRQCRFMHRDLKPANLLYNKGVVKISDLGTAIQIGTRRPFCDYCTTRYYRAPEMLIRSYEKDESLRPFIYDEKVDMWAAGTIIAELFLMSPLFKGTDSADQLVKICEVIGAPTRVLNNPKLEPEKGVGFRALMPYGSEAAIDLIQSLCSWDPSKRPSAAEALHHPFFTRAAQIFEAPPPGFSCCAVPPKMTYMQQRIY